MTRIRLVTLGIAVLITLALRLAFRAVDLSGPISAFFVGGGIAPPDVAGVVGIVLTVLIWWLIVYLVATRIPKGARQ